MTASQISKEESRQSCANMFKSLYIYTILSSSHPKTSTRSIFNLYQRIILRGRDFSRADTVFVFLTNCRQENFIGPIWCILAQISGQIWIGKRKDRPRLSKIFGRFDTHQCDNVPSGHSVCFLLQFLELCWQFCVGITRQISIMSDSPQYGESWF